jgi:hypothetical protein
MVGLLNAFETELGIYSILFIKQMTDFTVEHSVDLNKGSNRKQATFENKMT